MRPKYLHSGHVGGQMSDFAGYVALSGGKRAVGNQPEEAGAGGVNAAIAEAIAKERRRVLAILDAHQEDLGALHLRLINLVNLGIDLEEEAKRGPSDRPLFFDWPDGRQT